MRSKHTGQPAFSLIYLLLILLIIIGTITSTNGQSTEGDRVEVRWGVADTAATVGKLFRMHIPSDAFSGNVKSYLIQSVDGGALPSWLRFNSGENVLEGLPTPKDVGQIYLEILAQGTEPSQKASVTFTLLVRDVSSHTSGAPLRFKPSSPGPEIVRCKRSEPETVATLVLDLDLEAAGVDERISLLKKFQGHMGLHEEMIKLLPVNGRPMHDGSALVSGVGDTPHDSPRTGGTFISWPVGCGQVKDGHFPALQRLDDDSSNGQMSQSLRCPVIGWHVTNSHLQAPKRKRRAVRYQTATPVITPVAPTKAEEAGATEKMTHTVIDRVSPTMIQPTATQPPTDKTEMPTIPDTPEPPIKTSKPAKPTLPTSKKPTPPLPPKEKTDDMIKPTKTVTVPTDKVDPPYVTCISGQAPKVKNTFTLNPYRVGEVIDFLIPAETFEDCETGGTRMLDLNLFEDKIAVIPEDSFFQFDKSEQRLFGLPSSEDVGKYKLNLMAVKDDSQNLNNNVMFELEILPLEGAAKEKINHNLAVGIDYDYDSFVKDVKARMQLSTNIASLFGDPDASNIQVNSIERGSVLFSWSNKSMNSGGCPTGGISDIVSTLVDPDTKELTEEAKEKMAPFVLTSLDSQPRGACDGNPAFPVVKSKPRTDLPKKVDKTTPKPKDEENVAKGTAGDDGDDDDDDKLLTTIIPAVVIVVVLLITLLIACVLYRRKRKGKMNVEEKNTFINKHPPVIFPDELEDKPSGEANKPLLLPDSGANTSAAGPPPEYHRDTSESPERPTNNGGTAPTINGHHDDDDITEIPERPYDPPPPVTSSGGSGKTPRPTNQPFSQPPTILP